MRIYRISQNVQYLQSIGVPQNNAQALLNYLNTLPDTNRKRSAIQKIKSNPNISMQELQEQNSNKDSEIVEYAKNTINSKYYKWIARELSKFINSVVNWKKQIQYYKSQNNSESSQKLEQLSFQIDPITQTEFSSLSERYGQHELGIMNMISRSRWRLIMDWVEQNNIDILTYSFTEAEKEAKEWHDELAKREETSAKYATNNIIYQFQDGWTIVELSPEDCETEGDLMGHCVKGYANSVRENRTKIFSLRDPKNKPHVTIEGNYYTDKAKSTKATKTHFEIQQIQGKGNKEPVDEYKQRIREWFDYIKSQNIHMATDSDNGEGINVGNFSEYSNYTDEYGLQFDFSSTGIGGNTSNYSENLQEAIGYEQYRRGEINASRVSEIFDSLIDYAIKEHEIEEFDKAVDEFVEYADQKFDEILSLIDIETESSHPNEEDYMIYPDTIEQQSEFTNNDFQKVQQSIFNQQQYDIDMEKYQTEYDNIMDYYRREDTLSQLSDYLVKTWNKQKALCEKQQAEESENPEQLELTGNKMKTLQKTAIKKIPSANDLASYVESLQIYLKRGQIKDKTIAKLISQLPYPDAIRGDFSEEECRIAFESIAFAWKKVTKQDLVDEAKIERAPKGLEGNYWMISGGVILEGVNHFTIIKQNMNLFATLLDISTFVLHEKIASPPDELIKTILDHGGMRIFVDKENKLYCQVNAETFSKWARTKIKELDCKEKIVKVIDVTRPYKGWTSGITIKL